MFSTIIVFLLTLFKNLINFNLLTKKENDYLINYNMEIYLKLEKYLNYKEKFWLLSQF